MPPRYACLDDPHRTRSRRPSAPARAGKRAPANVPSVASKEDRRGDEVVRTRGRLQRGRQKEAQAAQRAPKPPLEKRGRDWRPGGEHRDPRDRFKQKVRSRKARDQNAARREKATQRRTPSRPWGDKPTSRPPQARRARPKSGPPSGRRKPIRPAHRKPGPARCSGLGAISQKVDRRRDSPALGR